MGPEDAQHAFDRAAAGDRDGFEQVLKLHQSMVFSIAYNFLHDQATSEELAQEVFLELYRVLPSLESAAHVTNWLRRVTTHRCIDQGRKERHGRKVALEDIAEPACPAARSSAARDPYLSDRLWRLTASLPERARAVVLLRYQEDMEPAEISRMLGVPVNSIKSQLQRSLAVLREKLERMRVQL